MPVVINGSTGISGTDGSASTPAVQGTDTNTGLFFPAADQIAFAEGGTEVMRIDSAGNVGVGTTTPAKKFVVSNAGAVGMEWSPTDYAGNMRQLAYNRSTTAYVALRTEASQHEFYIGGNERMLIDPSGNVGIGTSAPTQRLHVAGTGSTYTRVSSSNAGTGAGSFFTNASSAWLIGAGPASGGGEFAIVDQTSGSVDRMRIDASGNFQFNSGYGSVATAYGCRAWVNFNGTGTVAIRASGNVSSITDNGVGDYTVNFSAAMPNTNYAVVAMAGGFFSGNQPVGFYESGSTARTTSLVRIFSSQGTAATPIDGDFESVAVFR